MMKAAPLAGRAHAGGTTSVLGCGSVVVSVEADESLGAPLRAVLRELARGFSRGETPREPLRVRATLSLASGPIAQETPPGRYVPGDGDTLRSRWGFWDVLLRGFASGDVLQARLRLDRDLAAEHQANGIRMFLRTLVATAAVRRHSLMFHGCAMVEPCGARAHLFLGASGDGKTTMTRRLPRWRSLGDDTVQVRQAARGQFVVSGTPFRGSEGGPRSGDEVPLAGLHVLRPHADELRRAPLATDALFATLMQRVMWFIDGGSPTEAMMDLQQNLANSVPGYTLESSLHHDLAAAWEVGAC